MAKDLFNREKSIIFKKFWTVKKMILECAKVDAVQGAACDIFPDRFAAFYWWSANVEAIV
jgi:hypothetical protein